MKSRTRTRTRKTSLKSLTLQFIPYAEISNLDSVNRIKKLLKVILANKIILLQGKLRADEETRLIEDTMALIGSVKGFKGIELAVLSPQISTNFFDNMKRGLAKMLIGDSDSITIIGPASIVREMRRDPNKIQLLLKKK
ncbi:hypothetical protein B6U80_02250 [Candidatus Pacearchaeota archaeon ex4484_26]|nr:MAG: hypothetical protein B6U80_02250 [Candidatus Pacearchaeota archaeon ex4484_26]